MATYSLLIIIDHFLFQSVYIEAIHFVQSWLCWFNYYIALCICFLLAVKKVFYIYFYLCNLWSFIVYVSIRIYILWYHWENVNYMHIGFLYNGHQFPTRLPCVLFLKVCWNHNVAISSSFVKISSCCKFEGGP